MGQLTKLSHLRRCHVTIDLVPLDCPHVHAILINILYASTLPERKRGQDVPLEAWSSRDVRGMHDGIRQPRTRGGTPCVLPNECTPQARRVEIECLQTLVDPARVGDRTASTPARAGRRLAAQREQAEGRYVPNACEQLGAGTYTPQADSRRRGRRFHINSLDPRDTHSQAQQQIFILSLNVSTFRAAQRALSIDKGTPRSSVRPIIDSCAS